MTDHFIRMILEHLRLLILMSGVLGLIVVTAFLIAKSIVIVQFPRMKGQNRAVAMPFKFACGILIGIVLTGALVMLGFKAKAPNIAIFGTMALAAAISWLFIRQRFSVLSPQEQQEWKKLQPPLKPTRKDWTWVVLIGVPLLVMFLLIPDRMYPRWNGYAVPISVLAIIGFNTIKYLLSRRKLSESR